MEIYLFFLALSSATQHASINASKNSAEYGERSVITLGSLCLPYVVCGIKRETNCGK